LASWSQAVTTRDYELFRSIGLPHSREDFERYFGKRNGFELSFDLLGHQPEPNGMVKVRVRMSYGYDSRMGREQLDAEYRILLRETKDGLRYAGEWR
jgi:hypothetical protein